MFSILLQVSTLPKDSNGAEYLSSCFLSLLSIDCKELELVGSFSMCLLESKQDALIVKSKCVLRKVYDKNWDSVMIVRYCSYDILEHAAKLLDTTIDIHRIAFCNRPDVVLDCHGDFI